MNEKPAEVLIAVYLIPDLARQDYDALIQLVREKGIDSSCLVLVTKDAKGELDVSEGGDGRRRLGHVAREARRRIVADKVGKKLDAELPPGSAAVVAVYGHADADLVNRTLANAIKKSTSEMDHVSAKELKAGLAAAGAGLSGS